MNEQSHLFSQKLDRAALTAYFLGAIVPLAGFALVVEGFVLPQSERAESLSWIGLVVFTALLSLGSFLVLRAQTHRSLRQMDADNDRLAALLRVSSELAAIEHLNQASEVTVRAAKQLAGATCTYLFLDDTATHELSLAASAGDDDAKRLAAIDPALQPILRLVLDEVKPVLRSAGGERNASIPDFAAAAVPLHGDAAPLGVLVAVSDTSSSEASAATTDALATLGALASVALRSGDLRDAQRNFFSHVTEILVTALDVHLGFHEGHGNRVAALSNRMGRGLGFDDAAMQRLHFAALLHDIGMLKLDRNQQMNPSTCERHSLLGARMLGRIRLWKDMAPAVEHHHEWFDGSGYPGGLAGSEIPLEARIIAICDAYDTMTSADSYADARSPSEAMTEIERCAGTQFDPELVPRFRRTLEEAMLIDADPGAAGDTASRPQGA